MVPAEKPLVVQIAEGDGWHDWVERPNFAASEEDDDHFVVDAVNGEIQFGPAVRLADGSVRHYGAVPPKGAVVRIPLYRPAVAVRAMSRRGRCPC